MSVPLDALLECFKKYQYTLLRVTAYSNPEVQDIGQEMAREKLRLNLAAIGVETNDSVYVKKEIKIPQKDEIKELNAAVAAAVKDATNKKYNPQFSDIEYIQKSYDNTFIDKTSRILKNSQP